MNRLVRMWLLILLGGALLLPCGLRAQNQNDKDAAKKNKKNLQKLQKELDTPYKKWLQEEVPYIISDEERSAFLQLQTNEEREQFIEAFWQRRDPTPDSEENEFKEEHYRRIAYSNEKFASGIPGWKTDRGRIYIMWGKPDEIDAHPTGGNYNRPISEGGGSTTTYAYETWRYRYMEGIGNDIHIEFVDPTTTGEYHISLDPGEKDALANVPGGGLSMLEMLNGTDKSARFSRTDGSTAPLGPMANKSEGGDNQEFNRLEQYTKIQKAPPVKFKDLEEVVSSRILRNQIQFDYRYDFLRITSDSILVPITVQIQNKQMTFKTREGVHSATLNIFARITTLTGRIVQTFEDTIQRDFPDSLLEPSLKSYSIYQKAVPLRPGLYKIDIVIKDVNSGNVGVLNNRLAVSAMPDEKFDASTLILADQMEPVGTRDVGIGQFVIGSTKVRPNLRSEFTADQPMGIYLQFYNLKTDDKSHKNGLSLDVKVSEGNRTVAHDVESGEQLKQTGEQVTFQRTILPKVLPPGKYKIEIQATDQITKQTVSRSADFTVTPSTKEPAPSAPGR